jgi:type III secretion protein C
MGAHASYAIRASLLFLSVAAFLASGSTGHSAPLPGGGRVVQYSVVEQDIGGAITGIAASLGLRVNVSGKVHGIVHGRLAATTAVNLLRELGTLYGFDWYCDGDTLYVTAYEEADHKLVSFAPASGKDVLTALNALGISDPRWPVRISETGSVALVNGPPRFVALVEETASNVAAHAGTSHMDIHVFRGAAAAGS